MTTRIERFDLSTNKIAIINEIMEAVCDITRIEKKDLMGQKRSRPLTDARKIFCHIVKSLPGSLFTFQEVGWAINRSHCTVLYFDREAVNLMEFDKSFKDTMTRIKARITSFSMSGEQKTEIIELIDERMTQLKKWLVDHPENPYRIKILEDLRTLESERKKTEKTL